MFFYWVYLLFCLFNRRQKEAELKLVEEVAAKRLEELVAKRVEEELERRKDEIEAEVLRRVEEAKQIMEKQMLEELQAKKRQQEEDQKKREVKTGTIFSRRPVLMYSLLRMGHKYISLCLQNTFFLSIKLIPPQPVKIHYKEEENQF